MNQFATKTRSMPSMTPRVLQQKIIQIFFHNLFMIFIHLISTAKFIIRSRFFPTGLVVYTVWCDWLGVIFWPVSRERYRSVWCRSYGSPSPADNVQSFRALLRQVSVWPVPSVAQCGPVVLVTLDRANMSTSPSPLLIITDLSPVTPGTRLDQRRKSKKP